MAYLFHYLAGWRAAAAPANEGNDAKRAPVIAAILDFEIRARTIPSGVFDRRRQELVMREDIADADFTVSTRLPRAASAREFSRPTAVSPSGSQSRSAGFVE